MRTRGYCIGCGRIADINVVREGPGVPTGVCDDCDAKDEEPEQSAETPTTEIIGPTGAHSGGRRGDAVWTVNVVRELLEGASGWLLVLDARTADVQVHIDRAHRSLETLQAGLPRREPAPDFDSEPFGPASMQPAETRAEETATINHVRDLLESASGWLLVLDADPGEVQAHIDAALAALRGLESELSGNEEAVPPRRVVSARITAMPARLGDPPPEVWATFDDGEEVRLFHFFPDEYVFTAEEFQGLTEAEARALHFQRDRAYLLDDSTSTSARPPDERRDEDHRKDD